MTNAPRVRLCLSTAQLRAILRALDTAVPNDRTVNVIFEHGAQRLAFGRGVQILRDAVDSMERTG